MRINEKEFLEQLKIHTDLIVMGLSSGSVASLPDLLSRACAMQDMLKIVMADPTPVHYVIDRDPTFTPLANAMPGTGIMECGFVPDEDAVPLGDDEGYDGLENEPDSVAKYTLNWLRCDGPHKSFVEAGNGALAAKVFFEANPNIDTVMVCWYAPHCEKCTDRCDEGCSVDTKVFKREQFQPPF